MNDTPFPLIVFAIMTLGFILKLRSMGLGRSSYEYLLTQLSHRQLEKFDLLS